jgi:hypothetical protein
MTLDTQELIRRLGDDATPVRTLPAPSARAVLWLLISVPYTAAMALAYQLLGEPILHSLDARFLIEELALITTTIAAALAAFCCIIPGRNRQVGYVPLLPLAIWLVSVGYACLSGWMQLGSVSLGLPPDWSYFPKFALIGLVPAIVMISMLRRGAPLYPRSTLALGALAVAALANVGLRFFHVGEVTITLLACDVGTIALLSALAGWAGQRILPWPYAAHDRETIA